MGVQFMRRHTIFNSSFAVGVPEPHEHRVNGYLYTEGLNSIDYLTER